MESDAKILQEQQKFKKKIIKKMESQNKRYQKALTIIESLIKENKELETARDTKKSSPKRTKRKSPRKEPPSTFSPKSENLSSFLDRTTLKELSKYYQALLNVITFRDMIQEKDYASNIQSFIESEEDKNKEILKQAIDQIQIFIKDSLNPNIGIPYSKKYFDLLKLFDGILDVLNLEPNLERIKQIVSTKLKRNDYFVSDDLYKLIKMKREEVKSKGLPGEIRATPFILTLAEGQTPYKKEVTLAEMINMIDIVEEFSLTENPIVL
jgi:hypothetical protein